MVTDEDFEELKNKFDQEISEFNRHKFNIDYEINQLKTVLNDLKSNLNNKDTEIAILQQKIHDLENKIHSMKMGYNW